MKRVAIIQVRMSSTRLPGKVLKKVFDRSLLSWMIERVKKSSKIDEIVIATSKNREDDPILTHSEGLSVYRGSLEDVLLRFKGAAERAKGEVIIRLTGDCPLIDPQIIDKAVALFETGEYEYVTNALERTYPKGMDVEVFSKKILDEMVEKAHDSYEREHVTPYLYQGKRKTLIGHLKQTANDSDLRITVDTEEDFKRVKEVIEHLYPLNPNFGLQEITSYLRGKE